MPMDRQISDLKNRICSEIIHDANIVAAINPDDPGEDLMYKYIFPTLRRPKTEQEKRTMICVRVDAYAGSEQRSYKKELRFVIYVITHDDLQRVESGVALGCTRTDYISEQIERIFNRTKMGISDAVLVSDTEDQIDARHPMRVITFTTSGFNGHACV